MSAPKSLPEIIGDMRRFYEANHGYPVSAGTVAGYARQLAALAKFLCPMKNANNYRSANDAFFEWQQTHEAPENAELPQWVKDFANWLMAPVEDGE